MSDPVLSGFQLVEPATGNPPTFRAYQFKTLTEVVDWLKPLSLQERAHWRLQPVFTDAEDERVEVRLKASNEFTADVSVPPDLYPGFAASRPVLLRAWQERAFSAEESRQVVDALATLLETNQALREHAAAVEQQVTNVRTLLKGAMTSVQRLRDLAAFRTPTEGEDET